jgi:DNA-binding GntR family transcriptional regulator
MAQTLRHRTLSAAIVDQLRQAILEGAHPSGFQLRQDQLAETFGVSRIPVREALFQLEAEGLVEMIPHKGAVVTGLSAEEINDVFDLRLLLEPRLLRQSLSRLTEADYDSLDAIEGAFRAAIEARDAGRWGALNARFHLALYARAPLPRTLSTVMGLLQTSDRYTRLQLSVPGAMERALDEHRELLVLCRRGDIALACALLEQHIESVRADLLILRTGGQADPRSSIDPA